LSVDSEPVSERQNGIEDVAFLERAKPMCAFANLLYEERYFVTFHIVYADGTSKECS
jgi:hypothetical protein